MSTTTTVETRAAASSKTSPAMIGTTTLSDRLLNSSKSKTNPRNTNNKTSKNRSIPNNNNNNSSSVVNLNGSPSGGGISDPEEYSSLVAAAVANIISGSGGGGKSEEYLGNSARDYNTAEYDDNNYYSLGLGLDDDDVMGITNTHTMEATPNRITTTTPKIKNLKKTVLDLDTIESLTVKSNKKGATVGKNLTTTGKNNSLGGGGINSNTNSTKTLKKAKSKAVRTKSKTNTAMGAGGGAGAGVGNGTGNGNGTRTGATPLRKSATVKPISMQESVRSLAITLQNAVSHSGSSPPKVPAPTLLPRTPNVMDLHLYLNRIQQYFYQLGYHRVGEPKIRVLTNMSMKHHVDTSRSLIRAGDPIKCLHALVLAIHFTNCTNHVERFPINFKSEFNGKEYKHVVLGVYLYGMFGALGISRDPGLQDKPITYPRLVDLILDYQKCYAESCHILHEVKIGGVITHDPHSVEPINWKVNNSVVMEGNNTANIETALEKISKLLRSKMGATCLRNVRPTQMVYPTLSSSDQTSSPATVIPNPNVPLRPTLPQAKKSKAPTILINNTNAETKIKNMKK